MSTITTSHGVDTWVRDDHPNRNLSGGTLIRLQSSHRRGLVRLPVTDIRGRTVLSATLTGVVSGTFSAQNVTVAAAASGWAAGRVTWNSQPTVSTTVTTAVGATTDGAFVDLDVTAIVQSWANGDAQRGFRLSTNATTADRSNWYSLDSSGSSWTLTVELSDAPEQPSDLRPNQGAVASSAPILAWSYTDLGGDSSEQGAFKVQADAAADEVSPDFDSGWVTSTDPEFDLSGSSFTPLSSGVSTQWRVMTRDADGNDSIWSDWATFSYEPAPTLTMDSPTGGVIGDSTPDVVAHLSGETLTQWRVRVLDSAGNVLWNSGLRDGAIAVTIPKRNSRNERVIHTDDATYTFNVRAWGDVERAVAVGYPAYVEQSVDVVFDDDAGVATPTSFGVTQFAAGDPRTAFSWHLSSAPDAILLLDGNKVYARLDSDDWTNVAGDYTWTDSGGVDPFEDHAFTIRAVVSGVRSLPSSTVTFHPTITGVWLVPIDDDPIRLDTTTSIDQFTTTDRRAVYKPLNRDVDVSIVYGLEGLSGNFTGLLSDQQDQAAAVERLQALRADVSQIPHLVWGIAIPVEVRNLKVAPAAVFTDGQRVWNVSFDFIQAGD